MKTDVIVIGAGAAGLMAAIEAGKRGRSVVVLDHAGKAGSKIRISGGGRCNFTNIGARPDNYLSGNPHFCKSALSRFTPNDIIYMLQAYRIPFHEKEDGRMFLNCAAGEMVRMLQHECRKAGVTFQFQSNISRVTKEDIFHLSTGAGAFFSKSVVIATGGLSYPAIGATGLGHLIARSFGIRVTPLKPGLVPLSFNSRDSRDFAGLAGISLEAEVKCKDKRFRGKLLFTHRGLSGPAVLQSSLYWDKGDVITVDLLPGFDFYDFLAGKKGSRMELRNLLCEFFPDRFSRNWCEINVRSKPLNQYSLKQLKDISDRLHTWKIAPYGTEGYEKAEVTAGGVDTEELSSKTMESKKVSGLFFAGEVIDVTGQLGGYNLQWAWASGYAAGQYA